jgi:hypothetical protein
MKKFAIASIVLLPVVLAGCMYSHERDVAAAPAPTVVERRVVPETTTTITQTPGTPYVAPGTVTTTTRRDTVIENHY